VIIDASDDEWFDLGDIPADVCVRITGRTCAALTSATPGALTATGTSFVQIFGDTTLIAHAHAHIEAFDDSVVLAHGDAVVVGNDRARIRADNTTTVYGHHHCRITAAGHSHVAATDEVSVHISEPTHRDGYIHLWATPHTPVTGNLNPLTLTTDEDPTSALAEHYRGPHLESGHR
jgi:hypothetical protein